MDEESSSERLSGSPGDDWDVLIEQLVVLERTKWQLLLKRAQRNRDGEDCDRKEDGLRSQLENKLHSLGQDIRVLQRSLQHQQSIDTTDAELNMFSVVDASGLSIDDVVSDALNLEDIETERHDSHSQLHSADQKQPSPTPVLQLTQQSLKHLTKDRQVAPSVERQRQRDKSFGARPLYTLPNTLNYRLLFPKQHSAVETDLVIPQQTKQRASSILHLTHSMIANQNEKERERIFDEDSDSDSSEEDDASRSSEDDDDTERSMVSGSDHYPPRKKPSDNIDCQALDNSLNDHVEWESASERSESGRMAESGFEFCVVDAEWSSLLDQSQPSPLVPSQLSWRYPHQVDDSRSNTQHVQEQNFFFPSGVRVELISRALSEVRTRLYNHKRHVVAFSDRRGRPLYACCLTVTQQYSVQQISADDHRIIDTLKRNRCCTKSATRIQKAFRQYARKKRQRAWKSSVKLSSPNGSTDTTLGATSSGEASKSNSFLSRMFRRSVAASTSTVAPPPPVGSPLPAAPSAQVQISSPSSFSLFSRRESATSTTSLVESNKEQLNEMVTDIGQFATTADETVSDLQEGDGDLIGSPTSLSSESGSFKTGADISLGSREVTSEGVDGASKSHDEVVSQDEDDNFVVTAQRVFCIVVPVAEYTIVFPILDAIAEAEFHLCEQESFSPGGSVPELIAQLRNRFLTQVESFVTTKLVAPRMAVHDLCGNFSINRDRIGARNSVLDRFLADSGAGNGSSFAVNKDSECGSIYSLSDESHRSMQSPSRSSRPLSLSGKRSANTQSLLMSINGGNATSNHSIGGSPRVRRSQPISSFDEELGVALCGTELRDSKLDRFVIRVRDYLARPLVIDLQQHLSTREWAVAVLLAHLSVETVSAVIGLLLAEKSIVIVGKHAGVVAAVALGANFLLTPFQWEGLFVPLVPDAARALFEAPVPVIAGTLHMPRVESLSADTAVLHLNDDAAIAHYSPAPTTLPGEGMASKPWTLKNVEFRAYFVRLPAMSAGLPMDDELTHRLTHTKKLLAHTVRDQLHIVVDPLRPLEISEVDSQSGVLQRPVIIRNTIDRLLMSHLPSALTGQLRVLLASLKRHHYELCGQLIDEPGAWKRFIRRQKDEEFVPEQFLEPLRGTLEFQESMMKTQLFVSFMDKWRKEQNILDLVRRFLAHWIYFHMMRRRRLKVQLKKRKKIASIINPI